MLPSLATTELCAGDGSCYGYIEALGCVVCAITGDEEATIHFFADLWRDAIALIAHNDESVRSEWLGVDVVAIEQGAIDREVCRQGVEKL